MPHPKQDVSLQGDITGGVVASLLSLPEAMAFGAIVFVALGSDYVSFGVVSGLIALAIANLVAAWAAGVKIMSVGPYALSSLMLASAMTGIVEMRVVRESVDPAQSALVLLFLTVFLAGFFQFLLGALRLGDLGKFIPYPVIAGLMNGIAILILSGQIRPLLGLSNETSLLDIASVAKHMQPLTFSVGVVTALVIIFGKRISKKVPAPIMGIVIGAALYYALSAMGYRQALGPIIGEIPFRIPLPEYALSMFALATDSEMLRAVIRLIPLAAAVAVVVSVRTLLGALTIDNYTQERSSTNRELLGQGLGNMVTSIFGGVTAAGYSGQPIANYANGGRTRRARLTVGIFALAVLMALGPVVGLIPKAVLAGMLVSLAIGMFDPWSFGLVSRMLSPEKRNRSVALDLILVLLVAGLMVFVGIFEGVGGGILVSVMSFLHRMSRTTIRREYDAKRVRSNVERQLDEINLLEEHGGQIHLFELEGSLFFGAADRLAISVEDMLGSNVKYVILDFRRVSDIDSTGAKILIQLDERAKQYDKALLLSSLDPEGPRGQLFEELGVADHFGESRCFSGIDEALGWAEDRVLDELTHADRYNRERSLASVDVLRDLSEDEAAQLEAFCEKSSYDEGHVIFEQGDPGNELFIIVKGRLHLDLALDPDSGQRRRIATLCPGTICGEMAILDGKPRSATATAAGELTCYRLSTDSLTRLGHEYPNIENKLMKGLGVELAKRMRIANRLAFELRV